MSENVLRIVYLQAENVKRLKAIRIRPDKTLVRIEGRNAAGKSSVLDVVAAVLGGGRWNPDKPIREGAKKAVGIVDLDEIRVERKWTSSGTYLSVTSKSGATLPSPQTILDKLTGDLMFDPLGFIQMKPAEQVSQLKRLAGLDFDELDTQRAALFTDRTAVNRGGKAADARIGMPVSKPQSLEPIDTTKLAESYEKAVRHNRDCEEAARQAKEAGNDATMTGGICERLRNELREAENVHAARLAATQILTDKATEMKPIEVGSLGEQMEQAKAHNDAIVAYRGYKQRRKEADLLAASAEELTEKIEKLDAQKQETLAAAKFPVEGLAFDAEGVSFKGIPLSQASSAEQLRIGVAIGLAQKPRARIMLCRNGSLLDEASLQELHDIATEFDAQVFVERVAEEASPSAVFIEDGEVVETADATP